MQLHHPILDIVHCGLVGDVTAGAPAVRIRLQACINGS